MKTQFPDSRITVLVSGIFLSSCSGGKSFFQLAESQHELPSPMSVHVGEGLFFDSHEITNLGWREYMWWNRKIFGANSDQYKRTLPDTSAAVLLNSGEQVPAGDYLKNNSYALYPAVGISHEQAVNFSQWRTDRVMEYQLVKHGYLRKNTEWNAENYFALERLRAGELSLKKPLPEGAYYAEFQLPSQHQMNAAQEVARPAAPFVGFTVVSPVIDIFGNEAAATEIYHLNDNAAEYSADNAPATGNLQLGFRNVAKWKALAE